MEGSSARRMMADDEKRERTGLKDELKRCGAIRKKKNRSWKAKKKRAEEKLPGVAEPVAAGVNQVGAGV